jgi:hypothetical protein
MKNNIKNHLKNHKEEIGYATLLGVGGLICGCSIKRYLKDMHETQLAIEEYKEIIIAALKEETRA